MSKIPFPLKLWLRDAERLVKRWRDNRTVNTETLKALLVRFDRSPTLNQSIEFDPNGDVLDQLLFDSTVVADDITRSRELHKLLLAISKEIRP